MDARLLRSDPATLTPLAGGCIEMTGTTPRGDTGGGPNWACNGCPSILTSSQSYPYS